MGKGVCTCVSSLQNLAVPQDFYSLSVSLWNDLNDPLFDGHPQEGDSYRGSRAGLILFIDLAARSFIVTLSQPCIATCLIILIMLYKCACVI